MEKAIKKQRHCLTCRCRWNNGAITCYLKVGPSETERRRQKHFFECDSFIITLLFLAFFNPYFSFLLYSITFARPLSVTHTLLSFIFYFTKTLLLDNLILLCILTFGTYDNSNKHHETRFVIYIISLCLFNQPPITITITIS